MFFAVPAVVIRFHDTRIKASSWQNTPCHPLVARSSTLPTCSLAGGAGDETALAQLVPLVHEELRRLAGRQMRSERAGHTLQTTAIVNEAYLRLVDLRRVQWHDRAHFFALSLKGGPLLGPEVDRVNVAFGERRPSCGANSFASATGLSKKSLVLTVVHD